MKIRLYFLLLFFAVCFFSLMARLFYWQALKGKDLSVLAREQQEGRTTLSATRGEILASDKSWLVASGESWLVFASPASFDKDIKDIANGLAPILVEPEEDEDEKQVVYDEVLRLTSLLDRKGAVWVPLKSEIDKETKQKIEALGLKGIGFEPKEKRVYPEASTAAHLLGFVGKDEEGKSKGYFGLEGYYDFILAGKPGYLAREEDLRGNPILLDALRIKKPEQGVSLVTYIVKPLQLSIDQKLKEAMEKYGAASGSVVVMNPKSGGILAMSAYPSYDPQEYSEYGDSYFKNPVISSTFEPGSVFKVVVMASALDAGVVSPDTKCPICDGPFRVGKYAIETWDGKFHPNATMTEVIVNSDNVGMSYISTQLGKDKMYDYLDKFGIGKLTGIDLQGEATAKLREEGSWGEIDLATASFGQGVAVTPIQMIRTVAAIANKGVLPVPKVVHKMLLDDWEDETSETNNERIISEKAAAEITAMMVEAAKAGESKWTHLKGFKVAGKTGTAQIPIAGHYDADKTIASFVGFAPYDDPKFVMLVTLQEPQSSPWASETAAPLWYNIARDLFNYFGIQPEE